MGLSTTYTKLETDYLLQQIDKKVVGGYKGDLKISDPSPTEIGYYILLDVGTYTNLGGINATAGNLNFASFDGTTWKLISVELLKGEDGKTIEDWSAKTFPIGSSVYYNGKIYYNATTAAADTDVPGTSAVWVEKLIIGSLKPISSTTTNNGFYIQFDGATSNMTGYTQKYFPITAGKKYRIKASITSPAVSSSFTKTGLFKQCKGFALNGNTVIISTLVTGAANTVEGSTIHKIDTIITANSEAVSILFTQKIGVDTAEVWEINSYENEIENFKGVVDSQITTIKADVESVRAKKVIPLLLSEDGLYIQYDGNRNVIMSGYTEKIFSIKPNTKYRIIASITSPALQPGFNKMGLYMQLKSTDISSVNYLTHTVVTGTASTVEGSTIHSVDSVFTSDTLANNLVVTQKIGVDTVQLIELYDISAKVAEFESGISANTAAATMVSNSDNLSKTIKGTNVLGANFYVNYQGGLNPDSNYITEYFPLESGKKYRINGKYTAPSPRSLLYVLGGTPNFTKFLMVEAVAKAVNNYDFILSATNEYQGIYLTRYIGSGSTDSSNVSEIINSDKTIRITNSLSPFYGKKLCCIGDSMTMQGRYFAKLLDTTGLIMEGNSGADGNGRPLTYFPWMIKDKLIPVIKNSNIVTIFGGTNDYGSMPSTTIGSFDDPAFNMDTMTSSPSTQPTTIYSAVKTLVKYINYLNPAATIVFFTQPERGVFYNTNNGSLNPSTFVPPALSPGGLNMHLIAEAIKDCCRRLGVPCYDTHATLWTIEQLPLWTLPTGNAEHPYDMLHPTQAGGDVIGRQMGKFINSL